MGNITKLGRIASALLSAGPGIINGTRYHCAGHRVLSYTPKPAMLQLLVTHKCNSRCIMCSMWKDKRKNELTAGEIEDVLSSKAFDSLREVVVSGGEPVMRDDLARIVEIVLKLKKIKTLGLITNGLDSARIIRAVREIMALKNYPKLSNFNVSKLPVRQ